MNFFGETEHFSGKNEALRWSILVGKQKHNVQKPTADVKTFSFLIKNIDKNSKKQFRDAHSMVIAARIISCNLKVD